MVKESGIVVGGHRPFGGCFLKQGMLDRQASYPQGSSCLHIPGVPHHKLRTPQLVVWMDAGH